MIKGRDYRAKPTLTCAYHYRSFVKICRTNISLKFQSKHLDDFLSHKNMLAIRSLWLFSKHVKFSTSSTIPACLASLEVNQQKKLCRNTWKLAVCRDKTLRLQVSVVFFFLIYFLFLGFQSFTNIARPRNCLMNLFILWRFFRMP